MTFLVGLVIGVTLGMLVIGFLAIDAYDRGYLEAEMRRRSWRAELAARRGAVAATSQRHRSRRHMAVAGEALSAAVRPA